MSRFIGVITALVIVAFTVVMLPQSQPPQHGSLYEAGGGTTVLQAANGIDDSHLRGCDTRTDGAGFTGWSKDTQTGNIAFVTDNNGANNGDCTNKYFNKNHDKHGSGGSELDVRGDIQNGWYSSHGG